MFQIEFCCLNYKFVKQQLLPFLHMLHSQALIRVPRMFFKILYRKSCQKLKIMSFSYHVEIGMVILIGWLRVFIVDTLPSTLNSGASTLKILKVLKWGVGVSENLRQTNLKSWISLVASEWQISLAVKRKLKVICQVYNEKIFFCPFLNISSLNINLHSQTDLKLTRINLILCTMREFFNIICLTKQLQSAKYFHKLEFKSALLGRLSRVFLKNMIVLFTGCTKCLNVEVEAKYMTKTDIQQNPIILRMKNNKRIL